MAADPGGVEGLSAALAAVALVEAGVAWRRERRLSPVAIGCMVLCPANLLVVLAIMSGPS